MSATEERPLDSTETPLTGPPPPEVPLKKAPLVRVIAQVRFPLIVSVEKQAFIAPFQEAIRRDYPLLRPEQSRGVVIGPQGVLDARVNNIWRFHDTGSAWRVSLAPDFLALETAQYTSRKDFLGRFERVLEALRNHVDPQVIDRLGVRYIDRVTGENLRDLSQLVRPEVAGILVGPLALQARHAISESVFTLPEGGQILARWGLVPAHGTVDPGAVEAIDEPSWLLDVDAFMVETRTLDVDIVVAQAQGFAERIYSFFRWAVTDEFLKRYGGVS